MTQQTSLEAFKEAKRKLPYSYKTILAVFGPQEDLSNTEIASRLQWSINRVTPRVNEMRRMGVLYHYRNRPCSSNGRIVMTWRVV